MQCKLKTMLEQNKATIKVISKLSEVQAKQLEEVDLMLILSSSVNNKTKTNIPRCNRDHNSNNNNHQILMVAVMPHPVQLKVEVSRHSKEVASESVETESFIYHTKSNTFN